MAKTIEDLFFYLVSVFDLIVIGLIFLKYRFLQNKKIFNLLIGYCVLNSICNHIPDLISKDLLSYPVLVIFTAGEYLIFAVLFIYIIKNRAFHRLIISLSVIFLIVVILNYQSGKQQVIDSLPIGIETILFLLFAFYYLYEQMNILDESFIYSRFHFWIVIGSMIYLGGSFFIYIFANNVDVHILDDYWFLTYLFYIVKNIFFLISTWIHSREKKTKSLDVKYFQPFLN
jgi:hypothetical protein